MTTRGRVAAGALVAAFAVAAISYATFSPRSPAPAPAPPRATVPPPPHLVALGDSVAAGFAAGGRGAAYPALVAARLRYTVENLATPGATAATVLHRQLARMSAPPDVVTITVGANDIRFAECFGALFGVGRDPCAGDRYRRNLDALGRDLAQVLDRVRARHPRARVLVSRYYDPLPGRAGEVCGLDDATFSGGGAADRTVRRAARRLFAQRITRWERAVYDRATRRLARLNAVIDRVTRAHGARAVVLDFRGHDVCAPRPWVFPPDVRARLVFRWPGPDYAENVRYRARVRCVAPCGSPVAFTTRTRAFVGTLVVTGTLVPNGTPHPDAAGQRAIADAFVARLSR